MTPRARKGPRGRAIPVLPTSADLPHLADFLDAYLHQDFALDYATPAEALRAFLSECDRGDAGALAADWQAFSRAVDGLAWNVVRRGFERLGGAWRPASRTELTAAFSELASRLPDADR